MPLRESEFMHQVIDLAHVFGWLVAHFRPARTARGWRTPVSADAAGFPDLVLVRERVLYAELKSDTGKLSAAQEYWLLRLRNAGQVCHVWRPADWPAIMTILQEITP